ncbi:hypothetical protein V2J09_013372 [Rumex salicifolius]
MFPFEQLGRGGELSFQSGDPEEEEDPMIYEQQQQDLIVDNEVVAAVNLYRRRGAANSESTTITFSSMRAPAPAGRARGRALGGGRGQLPEGGGGGEDDKRRMQHREIERQRRQEMSALFSSLRSLLPLDYVKGKRSMSDHIAQSANYIKHLEGRIKELGGTRDQLTESSNIDNHAVVAVAAAASAGAHHSTTATSPTIMMMTTRRNNVEVFVGSAGLQVQISCGEDYPPILSTSLKVLLQAGLDVVSCVTNRLSGGGLLHNIHCQVNDDVGFSEIDVQQLQRTLYQLVCTSTT